MSNRKIGALVAAVLTPPLLVGLFAAFAMVAFLGGGLAEQQQNQSCSITPTVPAGAAASANLTGEQAANAATIIAVGQQAKVPPRGWVVALAAALQESSLMNLDHGDRDSVGLFQQRPSQGWGTVQQIMDPTLSAQAFYGVAKHTNNTGLLDIKGWEQMPVTEAAQAVQQSGLPTAYADHEAAATAIVAKLGGTGGATIPVSMNTSCGGGTSCAPLTGATAAAEQGLTPDALIVARCVEQQFGPGLTLLGVGERSSNPDSDHPDGKAVDVMIPNWQSQIGNERGWQIARWAQSNAQSMGVKYVIFDAHIWSVDRTSEGWRPYGHPSGATDPTSMHLDHVHISVYGNAAIAPVAATGNWTNPLPSGGYTDQHNYGECGSLWSSCHTGDDLSIATGTQVVAAAGGRASVIHDASYGNLVVIDNGGGIETYYAHLSATTVRDGQVVQAGQQIGAVGETGNTTGPHLHFEVRVDGQPVDPTPFMATRGVRL